MERVKVGFIEGSLFGLKVVRIDGKYEATTGDFDVPEESTNDDWMDGKTLVLRKGVGVG